MAHILPFDRITERDRAAVGGKGYQLAKLVQAGLPVPPGFCIKAESLEGLHDSAIRSTIVEAYRALGTGSVAVRSSAIVEDSAEFSYAGQFETILPVECETEVLAAIEWCLASRNSERVNAYRRQAGITAWLAIAIIVQRYVETEMAGVLFTRDPNDESAMLVEAGRGDSVVSGASNPARVHIDRESGVVCEPMNLAAPVGALAELGLRIESLLETTSDIEWAWDGQQFWILQARPITSADAAERAAIVRGAIEHARQLAEAGGTVWVRQSLAEGLPHPTPMTWGLIQRMLSGDGGLGRMYRDFGCTPDPSLAKVGVYDLIAGRPYLNLSREPRMQYGGLPLEHSFAQLKSDPHSAIDARAGLSRDRVGIGLVLRMPAMLWKLRRINRRIAAESGTIAEQFQREIVPAFVCECDVEAQTDYTALSTPELLARFERWSERVLGEFARHSLKPAALADRALDDWRQAGGSKWASQFAASFLADLEIDPAVDVAGGMRQVASGKMELAEFVKRFGHRGPREMELNQPRYCESSIDRQAFSLRPVASERHVEQVRVIATTPHVERLREFIRLREFAKHYFMLGTFQLRRMLLELDRRFELNGGIFFLTPAQLPSLTAGCPPAVTLTAQRRHWTVLKSQPAPPVLFSDDLSALGRSTAIVPDAECLEGLGVSAGVAEGAALVLTEPEQRGSTEPYVLVCPSSDPAWTPLLLGASAVVMENGGLLSHGAIVAREFGVPAVGGVLEATRRIRNGDRLRVDGAYGTVTVLDSPAGQIPPAAR